MAAILSGLIPTLVGKAGQFAGELIKGKNFGDALEETTRDVPLLGNIVSGVKGFIEKEAADEDPNRRGFNRWGYPVTRGNAAPPSGSKLGQLSNQQQGYEAEGYDENQDDSQDELYEEGRMDTLGNEDPMRFDGGDYDKVAAAQNQGKENRHKGDKSITDKRTEEGRHRGTVRQILSRKLEQFNKAKAAVERDLAKVTASEQAMNQTKGNQKPMNAPRRERAGTGKLYV